MKCQKPNEISMYTFMMILLILKLHSISISTASMQIHSPAWGRHICKYDGDEI